MVHETQGSDRGRWHPASGDCAWRRSAKFYLLLTCGWVVSCSGGQSEVRQPSEGKEETNLSNPTTTDSAVSSESEAPPNGSHEGKEPASQDSNVNLPAPVEVVATICEANCARVQESCSQGTADFCRASCRDYVFGAEECPVEIAEALRCQGSAEDFLLCSNISAPSCSNLYRALESCRDGKTQPQIWGAKKEVSNETDGMPVGWEKIEEEGFGFEHLMPNGFSLQKTADGFEASAQASDGGSYLLKGLNLGTTQATDLRVMNTAIKFVGKDCEEDLRLHGNFESKGVKHIRFDAPCKSGGGHRGFLHVWDQKIVIASGQFAKQTFGEVLSQELESFLFSFAPLKPSVAE
jgi:hypothetical protein